MRSILGVIALVVGSVSFASVQPPATQPDPAPKKQDDGSAMPTIRLGRADRLAREGKFAEAADEYVWLWKHALEQDPAWYGVRLSFLAGSMKDIAAKSPESRQRFIVLRDETGERLKQADAGTETVVDWAALNDIVGEPERTGAWFRTVKDEARWRPAIARIADGLESSFVKSGEWAEIGRLHEDPVKIVEQLHQVALMAPGARPEPKAGEGRVMQGIAAMMLHRRAGRLYAGLLAAGREEDAKKFAARAREIDGSLMMLRSLIATALQAGQARPEQWDWFDQFGDAGPDDAKLAALGRDVLMELGVEQSEAIERTSPK